MGLVTESESGIAVQPPKQPASEGIGPATGVTLAWRLAGWKVALASIAIVLAYWGTATSLVDIWWRSETFTHCFLVLPIALYLAWSRLPTLQDKVPDGSWWGLAVVAAGVTGWWLGETADTQLVTHFAFVVMLQGALLASLGLRCYKAMLFPSLYLFLMVPFGEFAISPLQDLTAEYTVMLARASGVPVFIDGRHIDIPGGSFLVAEACSGVRYLIATFALGLLVQDLLFVSRWRKALIICLSLIIPIVANVIRAYIILMMAYLSGFKIAVGVDHLIYGWLFFAVVTLILIAIAFRFREDQPQQARGAAAAAGQHSRALHSAAPLAAALSLAVLLPISGAGSSYEGEPVAELEIPRPQVGSAWLDRQPDANDWTGLYPKADANRLFRFEDESGAVDLFVASYAWERPSAELITFENSLLGGLSWDVVGVGNTRSTVESEDRNLATLRVKYGERHRIIWYFYRIGDRNVVDPRVAKAMKVKEKIMRGHSQASVIAVSTVVGEEGIAQAEARLSAFLSELRIAERLDQTLDEFAEREMTTQRLAEKES